MKCRNCSAELAELGLSIGRCGDCQAIQLTHDVKRVYEYRTNEDVALVTVAMDALHWRPVHNDDVILDIGCNDGSLLNSFSSFGDAPILVGIDSSEKMIKDATSITKNVVAAPFSKDAYFSLDFPKAKIVTTIHTFGAIGNPAEFASHVRACMADDGLWVLEVDYVPLILQNTAFDHINDENIFYYTLRTLNNILSESGFRIVNATLNDRNGGSIRVMAVKNDYSGGHIPSFLRNIGLINVDSLLSSEDRYGVNGADVWDTFFRNVESLREETIRLIANLVSRGKKIYTYGSIHTGDVMLKYYDIGADLISAEIPPDVIPDYVFVLPWHLQSSILTFERAWLERGTKFIFPLPRLETVSL